MPSSRPERGLMPWENARRRVKARGVSSLEASLWERLRLRLRFWFSSVGWDDALVVGRALEDFTTGRGVAMVVGGRL